MLESLLHDILPCMKQSMKVLSLVIFLMTETHSASSTDFSQYIIAVLCVTTCLCLVRSTVTCIPTVNVNSGVCAPAYLAAIKAARFCKQTDSNGASTLISYTCLRTLLPRATAYKAQQVTETSAAATKHTRCTCLLAFKLF